MTPIRWWPALLIVVTGFLIYANSVSNPFVLDDQGTIVENEQIRHLWSLATLNPAPELAVAGRPVVAASLAINYALGGLGVAGYHLANIALHVTCALLLFAVVRRTLLLTSKATWTAERSTPLACAVALVWLIHPLNTEVVDYTTQRTESVMALCYLLTLYASIRAHDSGPSTRWGIAAVVACFLGMGSKESMVTAPIAVLLFDRVFLFESFIRAWRSRWRLYLGLASTWILLAALVSTGPRQRSAGFSTGITAWTYLLNQVGMITHYLRESVWPRALVANYGWPLPLTLGDVWPGAVVLAMLLVLTVAALRWHRPIGFLGAWVFLTLAPTSTIVPIATEVGAERRMYLPLAALVVLAVIAAAWLYRRVHAALGPSEDVRRLVTIIGGVLGAAACAALVLGTVTRNAEYRSRLQLARTVVERYPTPVAHHVLAEELIKTGDRRTAMTHLSQALPGDPRAHYTMGVELYKDEHLDEAISELRAFIREQPRLIQVIEARGYLGKALARQQRWSESVAEFREILAMTPVNPLAQHSLAEALFSERAFEEAITHYRAYLDTEPDDVDALNHLGMALGITGKNQDALRALQRAVRLAPFNADSHELLGRALAEDQQFAEASREFERALQLDPTDRQAADGLRRVTELIASTSR